MSHTDTNALFQFREQRGGKSSVGGSLSEKEQLSRRVPDTVVLIISMGPDTGYVAKEILAKTLCPWFKSSQNHGHGSSKYSAISIPLWNIHERYVLKCMNNNWELPLSLIFFMDVLRMIHRWIFHSSVLLSVSSILFSIYLILSFFLLQR